MKNIYLIHSNPIFGLKTKGSFSDNEINTRGVSKSEKKRNTGRNTVEK